MPKRQPSQAQEARTRLEDAKATRRFAIFAIFDGENSTWWHGQADELRHFGSSQKL